MDFKAAQNYWVEHDQQGKKVEDEKLIGIIEDFIGKHNVMGLATACGEIVRNTPVEYDYWKDAFWLLSEGGRKFWVNHFSCVISGYGHKSFGLRRRA